MLSYFAKLTGKYFSSYSNKIESIGSHTSIHEWNEPSCFTPSRRASLHFGPYSFPVPLRVGGWVGLGGWLHTEVPIGILCRNLMSFWKKYPTCFAACERCDEWIVDYDFHSSVETESDYRAANDVKRAACSDVLALVAASVNSMKECVSVREDLRIAVDTKP